MQYAMKESNHRDDVAGNELFYGSRRSEGFMAPSNKEALRSPFGNDIVLKRRVHNPLSDLTVDEALARGWDGSKISPWLSGSAVMPPYNKPIHQGSGSHSRNTSWRSGDRMPLEPDRVTPRERPARDPDLVGYPSRGKAGYGGEMLFGHRPPERPPLDMQIAQWRLGNGANDPNPYTIDGTVPTSSPRRDPRRRVQREIMASFAKDDTLGSEAVRREQARHELTEELEPEPEPAIAAELQAMSLFPSPRRTQEVPSPRSNGINGAWRAGDSHPLTLDGSIIERQFHLSKGSAWRTGDTSGFSLGEGALSSSPLKTMVMMGEGAL